MATAVKLQPVKRPREPRLAVAWEPRWRTLATSLLAVLGGPIPPKEFKGLPYFRDCCVHSALPKRSILASALWHIAIPMLLSLPLWKPGAPPAQLTLPRIEVAWYGPIQDLPPIQPAATSVPRNKPTVRRQPDKPLPSRGADAFHPRQTIISAPLRPSHPRQTLIRPDAPPEPPKILPPMPNIVQWSDAAQPTRPRLQISREALAKLRPKKPAMRPASEMPVPEVPNLEKQVGPLNISANAAAIPKPWLPMAPTSVPRVGPRQTGQDVGPAPDIGPNLITGDSGVQRLVALSPTPAPPSTSVESLPLPAGNLAARFSISPEGPKPGVPAGSPTGIADITGGNSGGPGSPSGYVGSGNGSGPPSVSITSGSPNASSLVSEPGRPDTARSGLARPLAPKPDPRAAPPGPTRTPPAPGFDSIKPGSPPEQVFGPKPVYTLHVNMPNLSSVTGSWVLSFVEIPREDGPGSPPGAGGLSGPVPLRKVDPKYPPEMISARVEGEVVLYAVIRRDGSVDSIQLVRGIEPELDNNAMQALARWRFRPAERKGSPVELEAIVHIPFRAVNRPF